MDFVDKVAEGARDFADTVVRTTSDLIEKGKVSLEVSKLKGDRREALIALGELTYGIEKGYGGEGAKDELVARLDEIAEKINDIESQREAERQQREDAREAERVRREAAQAAGQTTEPPEKERCRECGQERIGSLDYCGYCGARFE